jgi:homoserine O-succinyltransferase
MTMPTNDDARSNAQGAAPPSLTIGVVNNMPEAAFQATVDQFHHLLRQAIPERTELVLRIFRSGDREDTKSPADCVPQQSEPATALWTSTLDGLIVTGAEPQADRIVNEPCMPLLSEIVDWTEACAIPTVWSCLAAHAAVYRLDGIERQTRAVKLFGVFEFEKVRQHALLEDSPGTWTIPHSRFNELSETRLTASGYQILTRSSAVGPDTFVKHSGASHLFLNGHPEYGLSTLHSEYRRDVRRFLLGERATYPDLPTGYFPEEAAFEMAEFRKKGISARASRMLADFPDAVAKAMPWRSTAVGLFRNWMLAVIAQKTVLTRPCTVLGGSGLLASSRADQPLPNSSAAPHFSPVQPQLGRHVL